MNKRWPHRSGWNHRNTRRILREAQVSEPPELKTKPVLFYREMEVNMKEFWKLVKESTIVQGVVTIALVVTCCYLWGTRQPVPSELFQALTFVLGFFFGAKVSQAVQAR